MTCRGQQCTVTRRCEECASWPAELAEKVAGWSRRLQGKRESSRRRAASADSRSSEAPSSVGRQSWERTPQDYQKSASSHLSPTVPVIGHSSFSVGPSDPPVLPTLTPTYTTNTSDLCTSVTDTTALTTASTSGTVATDAAETRTAVSTPKSAPAQVIADTGSPAPQTPGAGSQLVLDLDSMAATFSAIVESKVSAVMSPFLPVLTAFTAQANPFSLASAMPSIRPPTVPVHHGPLSDQTGRLRGASQGVEATFSSNTTVVAPRPTLSAGEGSVSLETQVFGEAHRATQTRAAQGEGLGRPSQHMSLKDRRPRDSPLHASRHSYESVSTSGRVAQTAPQPAQPNPRVQTAREVYTDFPADLGSTATTVRTSADVHDPPASFKDRGTYSDQGAAHGRWSDAPTHAEREQHAHAPNQGIGHLLTAPRTPIAPRSDDLPYVTHPQRKEQGELHWSRKEGEHKRKRGEREHHHYSLVSSTASSNKSHTSTPSRPYFSKSLKTPLSSPPSKRRRRNEEEQEWDKIAEETQSVEEESQSEEEPEEKDNTDQKGDPAQTQKEENTFDLLLDYIDQNYRKDGKSFVVRQDVSRPSRPFDEEDKSTSRGRLKMCEKLQDALRETDNKLKEASTKKPGLVAYTNTRRMRTKVYKMAGDEDEGVAPNINKDLLPLLRTQKDPKQPILQSDLKRLDAALSRMMEVLNFSFYSVGALYHMAGKTGHPLLRPTFLSTSWALEAVARDLTIVRANVRAWRRQSFLGLLKNVESQDRLALYSCPIQGKFLFDPDIVSKVIDTSKDVATQAIQGETLRILKKSAKPGTPLAPKFTAKREYNTSRPSFSTTSTSRGRGPRREMTSSRPIKRENTYREQRGKGKETTRAPFRK